MIIIYANYLHLFACYYFYLNYTITNFLIHSLTNFIHHYYTKLCKIYVLNVAMVCSSKKGNMQLRALQKQFMDILFLSLCKNLLHTSDRDIRSSKWKFMLYATLHQIKYSSVCMCGYYCPYGIVLPPLSQSYTDGVFFLWLVCCFVCICLFIWRECMHTSVPLPPQCIDCRKKRARKRKRG